MSDTPNTETPTTAQGQNTVVSSTNESSIPITKFADDTIGSESHPTAPVRFRKTLSGIKAIGTESLLDWLKRPNILGSGTFAATDSGVLFSYDISSLPPSKANRMVGVYAARYDVHLTMQVNADRFHAGRYILGWIPYANSTPTTGPTWDAMRLANLTTITQLPHVEIDLAKQTHATLIIPWSYSLPAGEFSLGGMNRTWGRCFIIPYSPLIVGSGGATCPWTLWASHVSAELLSASSNQMNAGEKEAKAEGVGHISGILSRASKATNILGEIPVIGPYAMTVGWIAGVLSRSAAAMGWSKPLNLSAPDRVIRQALPFSANSDVTANSHPLGVESTNSIIPHSGLSGTNLDEMSFDFIKSQYAYVGSATWDTSFAQGSTLYTGDVVANNFFNTWSKGITYTPVGFLALLHTYFRGGFVFRFKLVKTEFHRGRLVVAFSPYTIASTSPLFSYASSEYVYREMVDISTTSEFEVCVPYMSVKPWTRVGWTIGRLTVFVENTLTAPSSVGSQVPILVEVKGNTDFRVACPQESTWEPYAPSTNQMADPYVTTPCFTLGVSSPEEDIESLTIGETLTSFRQILKRLYGWNVSGGIGLSSTNNLHIKAYHLSCVRQAATTTGLLIRGSLSSDLINLVSFCYAFQTGSLRYLLRLPAQLTNVGVQLNAIGTGIQQVGVITQDITYGDKTIIPTSMEGFVDVSVPNWQPHFARAVPCQLEMANSGFFVDGTYGNPTSLVFTMSDLSANTTARIHRTIGEDFSMFRWVGVPPIVAASTT